MNSFPNVQEDRSERAIFNKQSEASAFALHVLDTVVMSQLRMMYYYLQRTWFMTSSSESNDISLEKFGICTPSSSPSSPCLRLLPGEESRFSILWTSPSTGECVRDRENSRDILLLGVVSLIISSATRGCNDSFIVRPSMCDAGRRNVDLNTTLFQAFIDFVTKYFGRLLFLKYCYHDETQVIVGCREYPPSIPTLATIEFNTKNVGVDAYDCDRGAMTFIGMPQLEVEGLGYDSHELCHWLIYQLNRRSTLPISVIMMVDTLNERGAQPLSITYLDTITELLKDQIN
ncbi:hypothetical protein HW555_011347 [Spodoptera exigua]|uniref:Uncharacterized protein n=1 Tax=Spodoptera exigua TaxID=7107 RepID=A0A835G9A2_SPOEX|nr:hypothetical protein HW555_011347 [Spodoptera exigua]